MSQSVTQPTTQFLNGKKKPFSIQRACHRVKRAAFEIAITVGFLAWLAEKVCQQLGLPSPWDLLKLFR